MYAVGENGVILHYANEQWQPEHHGKNVSSYLRGVAVVNNNLIVAGGGGTLFTTNIAK